MKIVSKRIKILNLLLIKNSLPVSLGNIWTYLSRSTFVFKAVGFVVFWFCLF